ncbi:hypothetical protein NE237_030960 [Protea cynaroides]|uniref:Uncharacterized protein n=1 Tax=Protea cynaroides TaxID=273540 RepID=A0A9Q0GWX0_9MAGN|nr:hypothetical protein NE237_030960 [Protea cynaroides]
MEDEILIQDDEGIVYNQKVVYSWKPPLCLFYKVFGNEGDFCSGKAIASKKPGQNGKVQPPMGESVEGNLDTKCGVEERLVKRHVERMNNGNMGRFGVSADLHDDSPSLSGNPPAINSCPGPVSMSKAGQSGPPPSVILGSSLDAGAANLSAAIADFV